MGKPTLWILTPNQAVQPLESSEIAIGLEFWIKEEEGLYYASSENKGAEDEPASLICVFVFAYPKHLFSHDAASVVGP